MAIGIVIIISLGFGAHIFESTMKTGANQANLSKKQMLVMGAVFGGIQMVMAFMGLLLTWFIDNTFEMNYINRIYRFAALGCLFLLIVKGLYEAVCIKTFEECRAEPLSLKQWAMQAFRAGIKASMVGMSISYLNPDTLYDMFCVLCVSVLSAATGLWYGYWVGVKGRRAVNLSGAVLLAAAGVYIILQ